MPVRDNAQLTDTALPPAVTASPTAAPEVTSAAAARSDEAACSCPDFHRDMVCDHVLMAAAVRMVRRMIVAHGETEKPH